MNTLFAITAASIGALRFHIHAATYTSMGCDHEMEVEVDTLTVTMRKDLLDPLAKIPELPGFSCWEPAIIPIEGGGLTLRGDDTFITITPLTDEDICMDGPCIEAGIGGHGPSVDCAA